MESNHPPLRQSFTDSSLKPSAFAAHCDVLYMACREGESNPGPHVPVTGYPPLTVVRPASSHHRVVTLYDLSHQGSTQLLRRDYNRNPIRNLAYFSLDLLLFTHLISGRFPSKVVADLCIEILEFDVSVFELPEKISKSFRHATSKIGADDRVRTCMLARLLLRQVCIPTPPHRHCSVLYRCYRFRQPLYASCGPSATSLMTPASSRPSI
jgi:hypothetical protein